MENLTKEQLTVISQAVKSELDKDQKRKAKELKDYRLRNTTLLVKNYRMLRVHCDTIVEDLEVYEDSVYDPQELTLNTLMKYKARTAKMLDYFDSIFRAYHELAERDTEMMLRRWKTVFQMYVGPDKHTAVDMAEYYGVDERTVYRYLNKAFDELSTLLWGIISFDDFE